MSESNLDLLADDILLADLVGSGQEVAVIAATPSLPAEPAADLVEFLCENPRKAGFWPRGLEHGVNHGDTVMLPSAEAVRWAMRGFGVVVDA